jgi:hypothetical protein
VSADAVATAVVKVVTPVPAGRAFASRPARLLDEVARRTGVTPEVERGGRSGSLGRDLSQVTALTHAREGEPSWCFHPLYFVREGKCANWIDAYDDWSLAPDMSLLVRAVVARNYRALRRRPSPTLTTVNSRYMQLKLAPLPTLLVPNGVDPHLAEVVTSGDDRLRAIVMGHFFDGRTDWALLERILHSDVLDEVVVVGGHVRVHAMVRRARAAGKVVDELPATALHSLSDRVGPRTVFAVPHVVSDYTISQDLMKVYQAVAMGMPVCVPNALWPGAVDKGLGHVFELGVDVDRVLTGAARINIDVERRLDFAGEHAWQRRADRVVDALNDRAGGSG